jgi:uncharacterized tellurite resistance protein B-like protein
MTTRIASDEEGHFLPDTQGRRGELRERLDAASARAQNRKTIADAVGSEESALLDRLEQLGFTGDSARVLDLLPLVHVAWADGKVDRRERAAVLAVVDHRGIGKDSDACLLIEALLEQRPSETFMAESFALVHELAAKRANDGKSLVALCVDVAQASGGLLGFGNRVDDAEYELIQRIADAFGEEAQAAVLARLGKPR